MWSDYTPANHETNFSAVMSAGKPTAIDRLGLLYRVAGILVVVSGFAVAATALWEGSYYTVYAPFLALPIVLAGALWMLAGYLMRRRRVWTNCVVVGAFTMLVAPPVGTIIGVYTLVVLYRDETQSAFEKVRREMKLRRYHSRI
jgi:phosphoglycerol transferase MdoB-like AlkP superfamily enzyme